MTFQNNKYKIFLVSILFVATILLSFNINKPFIGHHDWNGAFWGSVTRNYLNVLHRSSGIPIDRGAINEIDVKFFYFSHYTPMLPLLFTASALLFGFNEASMRTVTVFFSLLLLTMIYQIGSKLYSKSVGLLAVVLAVFTPMFLYFGKLPDHEPIVTSLITCTVALWLELEKRPRKKSLFMFLVLFILALTESWASFFLVPFMIIHILRASLHNRRYIPVLPLLGVLVVAMHISLIVHFQGLDAVRSFLHAGAVRLDVDQQSVTVKQFTMLQFIITEVRYFVIYFTRILLGLTSFWIIKFFWSLKNRRLRGPGMTMLTLLFLPAASFLVTFRNLSYIHDYKLYLLLPFVSLASASVLISFLNVIHNSTNGRLFKAIVLIAIVGFVASERVVFLKTVLATSFNAPGYDLGVLIRNKTMPSEKTLVVSKEFESYFGVFVQFYANRSIDYEDTTADQFLAHQDDYGNYRYIILVNERTRDHSLPELLIRKGFQKEQVNEFALYDRKK